MQVALTFRLAILIAISASTPAAAQNTWSVFIGGGAVGFGGASDAIAPVPGEPTQYKPAPTTRLHLGIGRDFGRGAITIDAAYAKAGLGGYGGVVNVTFSPALTLYDIRLMASYAIVRLGEGSLRVGAGPMLEVWSGDAVNNTLARLGGAASIAAVVPVTHGLGLIVAGSMGVSGAPFDQETLDSNGLEGLSTWTRELGVGLRLSL